MTQQQQVSSVDPARIQELVQTCTVSPSIPDQRTGPGTVLQSSSARAALLHLHSLCRSSPTAAIRLSDAGCVAAAHQVLAATDSAEALGLLWSLSACEGTLTKFTAEALWDIVRVGRSSRDSWRKTASLSTLHNLLCYEGHDGVLAAGSLEFAVEVLCADHEPNVLSAAAKLLDQCCFDSRSKHTAVQGIPISSITHNLERCLARNPRATDDSVFMIVEDNLSLLWNASDDVFFTEPTAWLRLTERFCQPSLLSVLAQCLACEQPSIQQAAAATIHNFACNRALHGRLKASKVMKGMPRLLDAQSDSTICCILATVELFGPEESSPETAVTERPSVTASLVEELRRRVMATASPEKDSATGRLQELVGTRKLLSAIESLAVSDRHKHLIVKNSAVGIICMVLRDGRADERGLTHSLNTLLQLTFVEESRPYVVNAEVMATVKPYAEHADSRVSNSAKALMYALTHHESSIAGHKAVLARPNGIQLQLSYHESDKDIALRLRSSLLAVGLSVCPHDDKVDCGDFSTAVKTLTDSATILIICVSPLYKISPRARLMATLALRKGVRVLPVVVAGDSNVSNGWINNLRAKMTSDQISSDIPMSEASAIQISSLLAWIQQQQQQQQQPSPPRNTTAIPVLMTPRRVGSQGGDAKVDGAEGDALLTPRQREAANNPLNALAHLMRGVFTTSTTAATASSLPQASPGTPSSFLSSTAPTRKLGLLLSAQYEGGAVYVSSIAPDGLAGQSGAIKAGDLLAAIDDIDAFGLSVKTVTEMIRGVPPSDEEIRRNLPRFTGGFLRKDDERVKLSFKRGQTRFDVVLPRPTAPANATPQSKPRIHDDVSAMRNNPDAAVPPHLRSRGGGMATARARLEYDEPSTRQSYTDTGGLASLGSHGSDVPSRSALLASALAETPQGASDMRVRAADEGLKSTVLSSSEKRRDTRDVSYGESHMAGHASSATTHTPALSAGSMMPKLAFANDAKDAPSPPARGHVVYDADARVTVTTAPASVRGEPVGDATMQTRQVPKLLFGVDAERNAPAGQSGSRMPHLVIAQSVKSVPSVSVHAPISPSKDSLLRTSPRPAVPKLPIRQSQFGEGNQDGAARLMSQRLSDEEDDDVDDSHDDDDDDESDMGSSSSSFTDSDNPIDRDAEHEASHTRHTPADEQDAVHVRTRTAVISQRLIEELRYCVGSWQWFSPRARERVESMAKAVRAWRASIALSAANEEMPHVNGESKGLGREGFAGESYERPKREKEVSRMTIKEVTRWLELVNLSSLCAIFAQNHVDGRSLVSMYVMNKQDSTQFLSWLKVEIGVTLFGSALSFMHALDALFNDPLPAFLSSR